jgi:predicted metalloprotease
MKWKRPSRSYVEDRRGGGGGGGFGGLGRSSGGGGFPIPIPGGRGGTGGLGLIIVIAVIAFQMCSGGGISLPGGSTGGGGGGGLGGLAAERDTGERGVPEGDTMAELVDAVTTDVQVMWQETFQTAGREYRDAKLVLFSQGVNTGCGQASSQVGPFYCPVDETIYLDTTFFDELSSRFGAPGDFAVAYVIAHEFGHHVQTVLGISEQVRANQQSNPNAANELSIKQELQADCFAGLWAHSVFTDPDSANVTEITQEDIQEGIRAAEAVGDDRIQQQSGSEVNPDTWTHGSSEQRMQWFQRGLDAGRADTCDTFS